MKEITNGRREPGTAVSCCGEPIRLPGGRDTSGQLKVLAALADNTRLQIVEMLAACEEPLCVCDITSQFNLGQPTISHHLKVLRNARLVNWEKRGLWVHYSLNREVLAASASYLSDLAQFAAVAAASR